MIYHDGVHPTLTSTIISQNFTDQWGSGSMEITPQKAWRFFQDVIDAKELDPPKSEIRESRFWSDPSDAETLPQATLVLLFGIGALTITRWPNHVVLYGTI